MFNPEHVEKRLAIVDVKVRKKTALVTAVLAFLIVSAVFAAAEFLYRAVDSIR